MKTILEVRRAEEKDASQIRELANEMKIDYQNHQKKGFLVHTLEAEEYTKRIIKSKFFYVATLNEKVFGFLMCYDNKTLELLKKSKMLNHENKIASFVLTQQSPFIYGSQIGVSYGKSFQGIGKLLMNKLFEDMLEKSITEMYVAISHKPVKNIASCKFCSNIGFILISEVNEDSLTWGIYKLGDKR